MNESTTNKFYSCYCINYTFCNFFYTTNMVYIFCDINSLCYLCNVVWWEDRMITKKAHELINRIYWKLWCLNPNNEVSLVDLHKIVKPLESKEFKCSTFDPVEKDTNCIFHLEEQPVMINIDRRTKKWKNKVKNMKKLGWEYNKKSDSFIKKWIEELE